MVTLGIIHTSSSWLPPLLFHDFPSARTIPSPASDLDWFCPPRPPEKEIACVLAQSFQSCPLQDL